jgi:hypothetical protein
MHSPSSERKTARSIDNKMFDSAKRHCVEIVKLILPQHDPVISDNLLTILANTIDIYLMSSLDIDIIGFLGLLVTIKKSITTGPFTKSMLYEALDLLAKICDTFETTVNLPVCGYTFAYVCFPLTFALPEFGSTFTHFPYESIIQNLKKPSLEHCNSQSSQKLMKIKDVFETPEHLHAEENAIVLWLADVNDVRLLRYYNHQIKKNAKACLCEYTFVCNSELTHCEFVEFFHNAAYVTYSRFPDP